MSDRDKPKGPVVGYMCPSCGFDTNTSTATIATPL